MYDRLTAYAQEPALWLGVIGSLIALLIVWLCQLSWRQLRSLPAYITTSRRRRRHQNFVEIRRRIKNDEYMILMEGNCSQLRFGMVLFLLLLIFIFLLHTAVPEAVPFDVGFLAVVAVLLFAFVILMAFMGLLSARNVAARVYRAGMRRNKKTGGLEPRKPASPNREMGLRPFTSQF